MKKLLIFTCIACFACNNDTKKEVSSSSIAYDSSKNADIAYPYTASYSSKFEIGDPQLSKIILDLWKNWDNNTLQNSLHSFADTVSLLFPDGTRVHGSREDVISEAQKVRDQFISVSSDVQAWIPLKSTDKNENWVTIWGKEVHKTKDGKTDSVNLQETWLFDKNNKAMVMYQFINKFSRQ